MSYAKVNVETQNLTDLALAYAYALAEGSISEEIIPAIFSQDYENKKAGPSDFETFIEEEGFSVERQSFHPPEILWKASFGEEDTQDLEFAYGNSPRQAATRLFILQKCGKSVKIPEVLFKV